MDETIANKIYLKLYKICYCSALSLKFMHAGSDGCIPIYILVYWWWSVYPVQKTKSREIICLIKEKELQKSISSRVLQCCLIGWSECCLKSAENVQWWSMVFCSCTDLLYCCLYFKSLVIHIVSWISLVYVKGVSSLVTKSVNLYTFKVQWLQ